MDAKILIVEDEPLIAQDLKFLLSDLGLNSVSVALDYDDATSVLQNSHFDLALLDINLSSERDGIDLAEHLNTLNIPFIFLTSYFNQSIVNRAKKTRPQAYLVKPFNKHDLQINVEMVLFKIKSEQKAHEVFLKEKRGSIKVDVSKLLFLEAIDNYTKLVFEDGEEMLSQTLKTVHEKLVDYAVVRVHKSFCVKIDSISLVKGNVIHIDSHEIPIGRTYKQELTSKLTFF